MGPATGGEDGEGGFARSRGAGFVFEDVSLVSGDGAAILTNVSAVLPGHGITVLAGPSGAGKSTLLRICNRLESPTGGTVTLDGADLASIDPRRLRRRVGMVFQRPVRFGGTVRDNLAVADSNGEPDCEKRFADSLERVGLAPSLLDRQADDLSGGEAQRMCLARTLLTSPEWLLMDEPTSSLDPSNVAIVEGLTREFARSGMPIVWVTHDLAQARSLGDRVVVLVEGRTADADERIRFLGPDRSNPNVTGTSGPERREAS